MAMSKWTTKALERHIEVTYPPVDEESTSNRWMRRREAKLMRWLPNLKCRRYNSKLIEALREIYYEGVPASVLLLSRKTSQMHGIDMTLLLALGLLETGVDFHQMRVIRAGTRSWRARWNRVRRDIVGKPYYVDMPYETAFDVGLGLEFHHNYYLKLEAPSKIEVLDKGLLASALRELRDNSLFKQDKVADYRNAAMKILPQIEGDEEVCEWYSYNGILQNEIESYKMRVGMM